MNNIVGSIELLVFEEEFEKLDSLTIKELIGMKSKIKNLHKQMSENKSYRTTEQKLSFNNLEKILDDDYPLRGVGITDFIANENRPTRIKEVSYFNSVVRKNNLLYVGKEHGAKWIDKIDELIRTTKKYNPKEYMNEVITCECGCSSIRKHLSKHKQSKKHNIKMAFEKLL